MTNRGTGIENALGLGLGIETETEIGTKHVTAKGPQSVGEASAVAGVVAGRGGGGREARIVVIVSGRGIVTGETKEIRLFTIA